MDTVEELKQKLELEENAQIQMCAAEITETLKKYKCKLTPVITMSEEGTKFLINIVKERQNV